MCGRRTLLSQNSRNPTDGCYAKDQIANGCDYKRNTMMLARIYSVEENYWNGWTGGFITGLLKIVNIHDHSTDDVSSYLNLSAISQTMCSWLLLRFWSIDDFLSFFLQGSYKAAIYLLPLCITWLPYASIPLRTRLLMVVYVSKRAIDYECYTLLSTSSEFTRWKKITEMVDTGGLIIGLL